MHHKHRNGRVAKDVARDAAQHHLAQPAVPVGAHDEEVGLGLFRLTEQGLAERSQATATVAPKPVTGSAGTSSTARPLSNRTASKAADSPASLSAPGRAITIRSDSRP